MNLFVDTHMDDIIIILFEDNKIIREKKISEKRNNSIYIMPAIKEVLDGIIPKSIIVCNGPGSFTGVRSGVTICKTLAYTLNVPIRVISSLECMAISSEGENSIVAFNDKNGYYVGFFNNKKNIIDKYQYLNNNEFIDFSKKYQVITNVSMNYPEIFKYAMKKNTNNPHEVNPLYIKKLDVEK